MYIPQNPPFPNLWNRKMVTGNIPEEGFLEEGEHCQMRAVHREDFVFFPAESIIFRMISQVHPSDPKTKYITDAVLDCFSGVEGSF